MTAVSNPSSSHSSKDHHDGPGNARKLTNRRSRILNIFGFDAVPSSSLNQPPPFLNHAARSQSVGPSASISYTTVHGHGHDSKSVASGSFKKRTRSKVNLMDLMGSSTESGASKEMRDLGLAEVETQEWRVSVASDGDDSKVVIYADTPTNIYTLFRNLDEVRQLHDKLVPSIPAACLPDLPSTLTKFPSSPKRPKPRRTPSRRSSFLASFSSKLGAVLDGTHRIKDRPRQDSRPQSPGAPQLQPLDMAMFSPIASPSSEVEDPLAIDTAMSAPPSIPAPASSSSSFSTSAKNAPSPSPVEKPIEHGEIAAYLTSLANSTSVNSSRHWKAFVKVRQDDFESVRVERKVKRALSVQFESLTDKIVRDLDKEILCASSDVSGHTSPINAEIDDAIVLEGVPDINSYSEEIETGSRSGYTSTSELKELPAVTEEDEGTLRRPKVDSRPEVPAEWVSPIAVTASTLATPTKRVKKRSVKLEDFELIRVVGKGCAGKVLLVKHKRTAEIFAMKTIHKRHVLAHQELQHTLTEQKVLKRMSRESTNPFVIHMHYSFTDEENLYLVLDFHPGGDLATQLERWGRIGRDRARFYSAEIVEGVEALHQMGIIYRDLKPENVLLAADGHVVLVDFGLAAEFPHRAEAARTGSSVPSTPAWLGPGQMMNQLGKHWRHDERDLAHSFVGTAEYLAPEVIQGFPYSYEVDWWSLGTMLYEALMGVTPFWANNHAEMYSKVLHTELTFPEDYPIDQDTKSFIRGLLQKDPQLRLTEPRIKKHAYFSMIDFDHVRLKRYIPPYTPETDATKEFDTQNFSTTFLEMEATDDMREPGEEVPSTEPEDEEQQREAFRTYSFATRPFGLASDELGEDEETESPAAIVQELPSIASNHSLEAPYAGSPSISEGRTSTAVAHSESGFVTPVASSRIIQPNLEAEQTVQPPSTREAARSSDGDIEVFVQNDDQVEGEDDWERVEGSPGGEAPNGNRANTLFARGVVDRYKLSVLKRKDSTLRRSTSTLRMGTFRRSSGPEEITKSASRLQLRTKLRVKPRHSKGSTPPPTSFGTSVGRSDSGVSTFNNTPSDTSAASSPLVSPTASNSSIPVNPTLTRGPSISASTATSARSDSPVKGNKQSTKHEERKGVRHMATSSTEALKSWIHKASPPSSQ